MNEHEISFHVNNSWRLQIVQPEIKTWKDKESLCNVMCKIYKNRDAKKQVSQDCLNYLRWVVIISTFFYYLLISLFVTMDSISLILKENTRFFINNTFVSNARLILAKNQANAKQQPEGERLLCDTFALLFFTFLIHAIIQK